MPCGAKISASFDPVKENPKIARGNLDIFYRDMLALCPLNWRVDSATLLFTGRNRSIPSVQRGPAYLVYEAVKVLNSLPAVSKHQTSVLSLCLPSFIPCSITVNPSFLRIAEAEMSSYRFFTSETYYNFLTCDGAKTFVSFMTFVSPFKLTVWYATFAVLSLLWIYLTAQAAYFRPATDSPVFLGCHFFYPSKTLKLSLTNSKRYPSMFLSFLKSFFWW